MVYEFAIHGMLCLVDVFKYVIFGLDQDDPFYALGVMIV